MSIPITVICWPVLTYYSSQKFATLTPDSPCTAGEQACVNDQFAQCVNGKFVLQACAGGTM